MPASGRDVSSAREVFDEEILQGCVVGRLGAEKVSEIGGVAIRGG
jgi:hypothetical protein